MMLVRTIVLIATHIGALAVGAAIGVYMLPILLQPDPPSEEELLATQDGTIYTARFRRDLRGSDFLHWGEGEVRVLRDKIVHVGHLSPGPDYHVYLVPEFVETEMEFLSVKHKSRRVGSVTTFKGFIIDVPAQLDVSRYTTVVVWCESFSQFISAAEYQ